MQLRKRNTRKICQPCSKGSQQPQQQNPPGYSASPPGYNAPQSGYGTQQPGHDAQQPGHDAQQPGHDAQQPGYGASPHGVVATTTVQQGGAAPYPYVTQHTTVTTQHNKPNSLRTTIPELPMALAITLCVINCILPGIGTMIAGYSVLCCGNVGQSGGGRLGTFCTNFWIGLLQSSLTPFVLIGWIWSIMWGIALITVASGANKHMQTTTTTTVATTATQPVGGVMPSAPTVMYSAPV